MPRTARKISKTRIYHIMIRGINRQNIFMDDEDKIMFLEKLKTIKQRSRCLIYAYCLMNNHVHLLLAETDEAIGSIMKRLGSAYAFWYNQKYDRVGHLFQDRYRSEPVDSEAYLMAALRYIHQNPVKAKISSNCLNFRWSSYRDYIGGVRITNTMVDIERGLELSGGIKKFSEFHEEESNDCLMEIDDIVKTSDSHIEQLLKRVLLDKKVNGLSELTIQERDATLRMLKNLPGVSLRQIAFITGVNRNTIQRL